MRHYYQNSVFTHVASIYEKLIGTKESVYIRKEQTRTQSLFMCFGGERRLGVRLRRARGLMGRDKGKIDPARAST